MDFNDLFKSTLKQRRKARKRYEKVKAQSKPGEGERFEAVKRQAAAGGAENPAAVAAAVGRKKYGKKRFQQMASAGKKSLSPFEVFAEEIEKGNTLRDVSFGSVIKPKGKKASKASVMSRPAVKNEVEEETTKCEKSYWAHPCYEDMDFTRGFKIS